MMRLGPKIYFRLPVSDLSLYLGSVHVLFCFVDPILGNRYGPGLIP